MVIVGSLQGLCQKRRCCVVKAHRFSSFFTFASLLLAGPSLSFIMLFWIFALFASFAAEQVFAFNFTVGNRIVGVNDILAFPDNPAKVAVRSCRLTERILIQSLVFECLHRYFCPLRGLWAHRCHMPLSRRGRAVISDMRDLLVAQSHCNQQASTRLSGWFQRPCWR